MLRPIATRSKESDDVILEAALATRTSPKTPQHKGRCRSLRCGSFCEGFGRNQLMHVDSCSATWSFKLGASSCLTLQQHLRTSEAAAIAHGTQADQNNATATNMAVVFMVGPSTPLLNHTGPKLVRRPASHCAHCRVNGWPRYGKAGRIPARLRTVGPTRGITITHAVQSPSSDTSHARCVAVSRRLSCCWRFHGFTTGLRRFGWKKKCMLQRIGATSSCRRRQDSACRIQGLARRKHPVITSAPSSA
mmetsp:Transcript_35418/g.84677  ORF Transcript_35418/g.84677 Transcript_35418/m.84677 type:complete len:248 (-) Transcript_35418:600-1343(-)